MPAVKPYKLGTYPFGYEFVDVWIDPNMRGGEFNSPRKLGDRQQMIIGVDDAEYGHVLGVTLHEALESTACDLDLRFRRSGQFHGEASDSYHFIMDHRQFSELCARVGYFVWAVQTDLMKAHLKHNKRHGVR